VGLVKTYEQLLALRFCLGIFEAGLFPGLNLYLTGWYRREEINRRASVFFAGAVLAGAFGGIFGCEWRLRIICHTLPLFPSSHTTVLICSRIEQDGRRGWIRRMVLDCKC